MAGFYTSRMGFEYIAYSGLETGNRDTCVHVVKNGEIVYAFESALNEHQSEIHAHT